MNYNRIASSIIDTMIYVIYTLYGIHKKYEAVEESGKLRFVFTNDNLLADIINSIKEEQWPYRMHNLYSDLSQIPYEEFEKVYVDVLSYFLEFQASLSGKQGEFFSPKELSSLIAYFVNVNKCSSVFDPFCGTASIVHQLNEGVSFEGQEISKFISILARINMEAHYGEDRFISCVDSILEWSQNHYDAVVSCPPFGLHMPVNQAECLSKETGHLYRSIEDLFFLRSFEVNNARMVISLEPLSFCYSTNYRDIRRYIVDNNYLDTIILLPEKLLYSTSISCVMVICKKDREKDLPVKFIDAEHFFIGDDIKMRSFHFNSFIKALEAEDETILGYGTKEQIVGFDYNLNFSLYNYEMLELRDGQELHFLGDLLLDADFERKQITPFSSYGLYPTRYLKTEYIDIWLNQEKGLEHNYDGRPITNKLYHSDDKTTYLLFGSGLSKPRLGLYQGSEDFVCHNGIRVAKINEDLVTPEYLVYLIVNHPALKKGNLPFEECRMIPFAIDSIENQKALVASIKQKYVEHTKKEQEAEAKRLGVKQDISDLEHMLGPTEKRLNSIISKLERIDPSSDNYAEMVKMLKDNYEYMVRILQYSNADFSKQSFNITDHYLVDYINKYADSWGNYGGNYFELLINNKIGTDILVSFDSALLTVMFDSILSNAVRHGFHKRKDYTINNQVEFSLSIVSYQNKPYALISIANNGDAIPSNFSIDDYITKRRYSHSTGRSGLGGYHVHQIVKGHSGFLYLDSNKIWNVVVEVLLPISNFSNNTINITDYEHECI